MTTLDEAVVRARDRARTVGVVTGAEDRRAVLVAIGRELHFPGYVVPDLEVIGECLRDLSWLPAGPVELVLDDAGLRDADPRSHRNLLRVLHGAAREDGDRPLRVTVVDGVG